MDIVPGDKLVPVFESATKSAGILKDLMSPSYKYATEQEQQNKQLGGNSLNMRLTITNSPETFSTLVTVGFDDPRNIKQRFGFRESFPDEFAQSASAMKGALSVPLFMLDLFAENFSRALSKDFDFTHEQLLRIGMNFHKCKIKHHKAFLGDAYVHTPVGPWKLDTSYWAIEGITPTGPPITEASVSGPPASFASGGLVSAGYLDIYALNQQLSDSYYLDYIQGAKPPHHDISTPEELARRAASRALESGTKNLPGMNTRINIPCNCKFGTLNGATRLETVRNIVVHKNDYHKETLGDIADWLDSLHDSGVIDIEFKLEETP